MRIHPVLSKLLFKSLNEHDYQKFKDFVGIEFVRNHNYGSI